MRMKFRGIGSSDFVTGLDIGTSSIKVVVAEAHEGKPVIIHASKETSNGMRKGAITDLGEASQAVRRALEPVKHIKGALKNIYVSIGSPQVSMQASRGIVAVSSANGEIYQGDIERAVKASQAVNLGQNRAIIHTLTKEFIVDGVGDIADPLGLSGGRLEVQSFVLDAFLPHVTGLMRVVDLAGGEVGGLIFGPLVAARAALSKRQKDLGAAVIDLGAGTTGVSIYEENKLFGAAKFPIGSANISNDLAIGLKIPVDAAENLKLHQGNAFAKEISTKELLDLRPYVPDAKGTTSRRFVAEIIESRLEEIFGLVNDELKRIGKEHNLPGGVIITGGGAKLPGITDLAKQELRLSAQIGCTVAHEWENEGGDFKEEIEDPEFVTAFGLALWGIHGEHTGNATHESSGNGLKNWFKYFAP
jgi:cell division protein FtsA